MTRYRFNHRYREPRKLWGMIVLTILVPLLLGLAGWWWIEHSSKADISNNGGETVNVTTNLPLNVIVNEGLFSFELPGSWKKVSEETPSYHVFSWQNKDYAESAQSLKLYVDGLPTLFGVNRVLPLTVHGNQLEPGNLSENCKVFTDPNAASPTAVDQGYRVSIWEGIRFWCDIGNSLQNVAATGSVEGGFQTVVSGTNSGSHRYTFVYTDHTAKPDMEVLINIIRSFRAK